MKYCTNEQCPDVQRFGRVAEYEDALTHCAVCGAPLADGPAPQPQVTKGSAPWKRLAVTVGVFVASILASFP